MHGELARTRCFSYICSVNCSERRPSGTHFFCVQRSIVKTFLPTRLYRREISAKNASPLMKIESFSIQNYKCIKDLAVDCRGADGEIRQWTVLLGENNTGKTNVLRALALLRPLELEIEIERNGNKCITTKYAPTASPIDLNANIIAMLTDGVEWGIDRFSRTFWEDPIDLHIHGYGVSRYPARTALSEREGNPTDTLFNSNARLLDFQEWLLQLDYSQKSGSEKSQKRLEKMHDLVRSDLFPGVTDFSFKKDGDNEHVVVVFSAGKDGDVRFEELGFGYQTSLTWLADLCKRLFELYPESENPLHEEAVVLVDELDLHLHPKWQRDIVPTLSKVFPRVQFIVTTHSPHVLQSMEDVNLYVLRRDAESGEVAFKHCPRSDFRGWTVEDILSETMGLGEKIHSDYYNLQVENFNKALDEEDLQQAVKAYEELDRLMKADDPLRRMFDLQLGQLKRRHDQA